MNYRLTLIAALVLSGCAPRYVNYILPPGKTYQAYRNDVYECDRDMRAVAGSFAQPRMAPKTSYNVVGNTINQQGSSDGWAELHNLGAHLSERNSMQRFFNQCLDARGYGLGDPPTFTEAERVEWLRRTFPNERGIAW